MKIGLFYELQTPRPWDGDSEHRVIQEALEQVEFADQIGIDYVWAVEHHFLEEYCHCSAPEVFLAAASQRTRTIRLGHGIVLTAPEVNHPARVAERIATLDQVSSGRVEFGSGEGTSDIELNGFGLPRDAKRGAWEEGLRATIAMLADDIFPGLEGQHVRIPRRSVVPKPYQQPHPPLWVACNRTEKIIEAARLGMGALNFSFGVKPDKARKYAEAYYGQLAAGVEPLGRAINPNIAIVTGFSCTHDPAEAQRAFEAMQFFAHAVNFYFNPGQEMPDQIDIRATFGGTAAVVDVESDPATLGMYGPPELVAAALREYEESGVDQVILIAQAGGYPHEIIMESLDLFWREVWPEFKARDATASLAKAKRLSALTSAAPVTAR